MRTTNKKLHILPQVKKKYKHKFQFTFPTCALLPSSRVPEETQTRGEDGAEETDTRVITRIPARLYRSPKSLHGLWHEYQFKLSEGKPAREYTLQERDKNKCLYYRRKVFWGTFSF